MNKFLEKFWLLVAIVSTFFTLIIGVTDTFKGISTYLLLCGLAWGLFLIRRGLRIKMEKMDGN